MEYKNLFCETVKSVTAADSYRNKGNALYKQGRYHEALIEYNKSICCAPSKSKELGLAFANRSSVYFEVRMYRKCVENIKLARENNYPGEKMKVLDDREAKCIKLINSGLRDIEFDVWDFFKLSYKANKKIPFIIDGLKLDGSEKYGRMIVTTLDLRAGDIIAIEEPCFKVLDKVASKHRCSFCLKNNHYSLIPCEKCPKVMFCSEACRDKDLHQIDCMVQPNLTQKMVYGAAQILKSDSAAFALVKEREVKTVFDFDLSNPEARDYETKMLKIVNSLSKADYPNFLSGDPKMRLHDRFLKISSRNSYQFGEFSFGKDFSKVIGNGVCAFGSLLNHSCYPNVEHVMVEGKMVFFVARPIKAGDQLFVSYGPRYSMDDIAPRKQQLFRYKFDCDCVACINKYPRIRGLQHRDRKFIIPGLQLAAQNAISQFRKNCSYINKHSSLPPSYEVALLEEHNLLLLSAIARRTLHDSELEPTNFTSSN